MGKINYQGKEVQAKRVAEILGFTAKPLDGEKREGQDQLWRDEAGSYYVNRVTWNTRWGTDATNPQSSRDFARGACRFETTHRLSINQVVLWMALMFTETNAVQIDLANVLMQSRKAKSSAIVVVGPVATTLSEETMTKVSKFARITNSDVRDVIETAVHRCMVLSTEDDDGCGDPRLSENWASFLADVQDERDRRVDHGATSASTMRWNTIEDLADGGMVICLHLKPEPARLMRAACVRVEKSVVQFVYDELTSDVPCAIEGGGSSRAEQEQVFRDNAPDDDAPDEGEPTSGTVFKLDETAAELVNRYRYATTRVVTLDQIVNGAIADALTSALNDYDNHSYEELSAFEFVDSGWGYTEEHIMRAAGVSESEIEARANYFERHKASEAARSATPEYDRNPQPDFSLNAAAPEPVEAPGTPETSGDADNAKEEA